jgi:hypothetical protein
MSKLQRIIAGSTLIVGIAAGFGIAAACPGDQASTKQTNLADNCDFSQPPPRWACGSMGNKIKVPDQNSPHAPVRTMPAGPSIIPRLIT